MTAKLVLASLVLAFASSCVRLQIHRTSDKAPISTISTEQSSSVVQGLIPVSPPIVLTQRCEKGWESITTSETTLQFLLRVVTLNMYSPWTARIECSKPKPVVKDEWDQNT